MTWMAFSRPRACAPVIPVLVLSAFAAVILWPTAASAQFETPSRAFHQGTAFPLDGKHLTVACESCHIDRVFKGTPTTCASCHWERRQDDVYKTRLGLECAQCHRTTTWSATRWDHAAATGMPLNASHRAVGCDGCHKNAQFTGGSTQCISCHQADFNATRSPNHQAAGFPTACESCHKPSDATFTGVRFDHNLVFPLTGVHAAQTCAACHTGQKYAGTPRDCAGCHRLDFERTTAPSHVAAGFSMACESCHRPTDTTWRGAAFNHAEFFPLIGQHAIAACATCHVGGRFKGTPKDCVSCHRDDYTATTNPNHVAAGLPTTCETCHRPSDTAWRSTAGFDHNQFFKLAGTHILQTCTACHVNGRFAGTPRDCVGCHRDDYDRTAVPSHVAAGFPTTCQDCHKDTDMAWLGRGFNHTAVFPLVGRHNSPNCTICHVNGTFRGTPRDCVGCHRVDYERTAAPSHVAAGFGTACESCHQPAAASWRSGSFNHASVFPLVGQHAGIACATCHVGGRYAGTPRSCYGCHRPEYEATRNPSHIATGFSTACESCHRDTDVGWDQGRFTHSRFPITSGPHRNKPCSECHTDGSNFALFTCITCHGRQDTDSHHRQVNGYRYESTACYACHPNGRAGVPIMQSHALQGGQR